MKETVLKKRRPIRKLQQLVLRLSVNRTGLCRDLPCLNPIPELRCSLQLSPLPSYLQNIFFSFFFMSPIWPNGFTSGKMGAPELEQMEQKPRQDTGDIRPGPNSITDFTLGFSSTKNPHEPALQATMPTNPTHLRWDLSYLVNPLQLTKRKHLQRTICADQVRHPKFGWDEQPSGGACAGTAPARISDIQICQQTNWRSDMLRCHMVLALCVEQGEGGLAPMGLDLGDTPVGCHKTNSESCSPSSGDPPRHLLTHGTPYKTRHRPRLRGKKYQVDILLTLKQHLLSPLGLWPNIALLQPFWSPPLPASLEIPMSRWIPAAVDTEISLPSTHAANHNTLNLWFLQLKPSHQCSLPGLKVWISIPCFWAMQVTFFNAQRPPPRACRQCKAVNAVSNSPKS